MENFGRETELWVHVRLQTTGSRRKRGKFLGFSVFQSFSLYKWPYEYLRGTLVLVAHVSVRRSKRLALVVAVNVVVALMEVVGGIFGHSMALLADAGHNAADVAAAALALVAVRIARRPPTTAKSFGYHRSGVLAAEVNAAAVLVVSVLIAVGAIARLAHPTPVRGTVLLGVALAALVLNGSAALLVLERNGRDLNMRASLVHMAGDAAASAGAVVAGVVLIVSPAQRWLDPAVSLAIAVLVGVQAVRLGREVADVLLEGTPSGTDTTALSRAVAAMAGIDDVHDLHIWSLSSEVTLLSAHLVMAGHPTLEQAQDIAGRVRARLTEDFGIGHATLELECETCADGLESPCAMAVEDVRT
jgi:cobalt-zinc-cadmium efflux system protein